MRLILVSLLSLMMYGTGYACQGQAGKVVFEDTFKDDGGGWSFDPTTLAYTSPGAQLVANPGADGDGISAQNQLFTAGDGDYCATIEFPKDAAAMSPGIGVQMLANDYDNLLMIELFYNGDVVFQKKAKGNWTKIWTVNDPSVVKQTGPNEIRAVVKDGQVMASVNGKQIKTTRIPPASPDMKFGVYAEYSGESKNPVLFKVDAFKLTAAQ